MRDCDGVLSPVAVVVNVNQRRRTHVVYALFGLALLVSNLVSLRSGVTALPAVAVVLSLWLVVAAVLGLVNPDATVAGISIELGEQPSWMLALLGIGTVLLFVGTALQL